MLIESRFDDGILWIRLNRPQQLNAVNAAMGREFLEAVTQASADPDVRVIILTGAGRAFCAGRDIKEPPNAAMLAIVQGISRVIMGSPKIFVAAAHGWVVGAGLEWVLNCDFAVFAQNVRAKLPEAALGVFSTGGAVALLSRIVGHSRAKALLLLGGEFDAQQAKDMGLAWDVVPEEALHRHIESLGRQVAALDPAVASRFKRAVNTLSLGDFEHAVQFENRMHAELGL